MLPSWASTATWLVLGLAWQSAVEARPALEARQDRPAPISNMPPGRLYVMIPEGRNGVGSPAYFRHQGGLSNQPRRAEGNVRPGEDDAPFIQPDVDEVGNLILHDVVENQADVQRALSEHRNAERIWLFEVATSPNMLFLPNDPAAGEPSVWNIIGGARWSQVRRCTVFSSQPHSPTGEVDQESPEFLQPYGLTWLENTDDYDPRWETFGATRADGDIWYDHPGPESERARAIMRRVTSEELFPAHDRRQLVRELLDWDMEREPQRGFPYLRPRQPESLRWLALMQADWARIPDISDEIRNAMFSGLPRASQCLAAWWSFSKHYNGKGPNGKGPNAKRADAKEDSCEELSAAVKAIKNTPQACKKIKNIKVQINLSDKWFSLSGTYDDVGGTLQGSAGTANFHFAESPSTGESKQITIDMKQFESEEIPVGAINRLMLTAKGTHSISPIINDEFTVQDISLSAECADPAFKAQDNKYLGINKDFSHSSGWGWSKFEKEVVGVLVISPEDWTFSPPCHKMKDLKARFVMGDDGTYDELSFSLGQGKRVHLGTNVDSGKEIPVDINMKEVFGKEVVGVRDLNEVKLFDNLAGGLWPGDEWNFGGITFTANCVDTNRKAEMKRWASVNQDLKHKKNDEAIWTGKITPENWVEVK